MILYGGLMSGYMAYRHQSFRFSGWLFFYRKNPEQIGILKISKLGNSLRHPEQSVAIAERSDRRESFRAKDLITIFWDISTPSGMLSGLRSTSRYCEMSYLTTTFIRLRIYDFLFFFSTRHILILGKILLIASPKVRTLYLWASISIYSVIRRPQRAV